MLASIPAPLLREWMAWAALEHLGEGPEWRADLRMAIATSVLANHWREKKPLSAEDVMPRFERPVQTAGSLRAGMIGLSMRPAPKANPAVKPPLEAEPA